MELAQRIRQGDARALDKLTRANLRFVVSVAKQYRIKASLFLTLSTRGNLGLIKAAQKFDETRVSNSYPMPYGGYASLYFRPLPSSRVSYVCHSIRWVLSIKSARLCQNSSRENERRPSADELADVLDVPVEKIADTLKVQGRHISVDAPFVEGEDNSLLDVLTNDDSPMADATLNQESLSKE